jgi:outer membrane protein assembly factor BamB
MHDPRSSGEKSLVRPSLVCLLAGAAVLAAGCGDAGHLTRAALRPPKQARHSRHLHSRTRGPAGPFAHPLGRGHLAPGSRPSALPADVLIADRSNNRLLVVDPHGRIVWRFPRSGGRGLPLPDDAFFSSSGREIVATQEDVDAVSMIAVRSHRIVWRYGALDVPGSGADQVAHPDDAMLLPDGSIVAADIENCRLIVLRPPSHRPFRTSGSPAEGCVHVPPRAWGSPNGAFPLRRGGALVTEINGDWVDALSPGGHVLWSTHPPGVYYPSDSNEVRPGLYVTVGWQSPGILETFDRLGRLHWRYHPRPGAAQLDHPSLALPLPNGDFLLNDDFNDRVIVIDPHTNRVVWQYGHTGVPGTAPGYLSRPDGVDLVPPAALLTRIPAKIRLAR